MNFKKVIISSILLAIGFILHQITPPLIFGMKPDFSLIMMFIIIAMNEDYKMALTVGIASGILSAAATTFPNGQIPNIIDKLVTFNFAYMLLKIMNNKVRNGIKMIVLAVIGTLISGTTFLASALFLFGVPLPFLTLILTVVLPATIINAAAMTVLYNVITLALKATS